jgi:hypothetical protein
MVIVVLSSGLHASVLTVLLAANVQPLLHFEKDDADVNEGTALTDGTTAIASAMTKHRAKSKDAERRLFSNFRFLISIFITIIFCVY